MARSRLSDEQRQLLSFLPDDGTAIGGYTLSAQLQEAKWRTKTIERVMDELRELGVIIVGRGGNGGSIRHVQNDRRALLDAIVEFAAEDATCTRQSLQQYMKWHPDYLEQVLDVLCQKEVHIGPGGGGGVITLAQEEEAEEAEEDEEVDETQRIVNDSAEDEGRLLALVPQTGSVSNTRLRTELARRPGWDEERYWETRKRLRQKGLIEVGRGRGGSVRRVSIDTVVSASELPKDAEPVEPEEKVAEDSVLQRLPNSGESVDLSGLQHQLQWTPDRFFSTLERLATSHRIHWSNSKVKRLPLQSTTSTPALQPVAVAPAVDPQVALYVFFRERFDIDSLERFIKMHLCAPTIAEGIGWNGDLADIAFRLAAALKRENYIDDDLFQKLRGYFPKLHPQIDVLAHAWQHRPNA